MTRNRLLSFAFAATALLATSALAGNRAQQPYFARGSVSQLHAYRGGYHVWVDGSRYPFYMPSSQFRRTPVRVGALVSLGGYYNRRGYYDYYCFDCGRDSYRRSDDLKFKYATVRGKVESIDARRDTFIIRAEGNDSPVTVRRGNDRGVGELRVGDYLEVEGEWQRSGYFDALRIDYAETKRDE